MESTGLGRPLFAVRAVLSARLGQGVVVQAVPSCGCGRLTSGARSWAQMRSVLIRATGSRGVPPAAFFAGTRFHTDTRVLLPCPRPPPYSVQRRDQNKTSPPSFAAFGRKGWPFLQLSVWVAAFGRPTLTEGVSGMSVCKTTKGPLLEGMLACKNVQRSVVRRRHAPDVPDRPPAKKGGVGGMPPTACFAWGGGATR